MIIRTFEKQLEMHGSCRASGRLGILFEDCRIRLIDKYIERRPKPTALERLLMINKNEDVEKKSVRIEPHDLRTPLTNADLGCLYSNSPRVQVPLILPSLPTLPPIAFKNCDFYTQFDFTFFIYWDMSRPTPTQAYNGTYNVARSRKITILNKIIPCVSNSIHLSNYYQDLQNFN